MSDVDLVNRVLNVRLSKFYKDRLVPIGSDLALVLERYTAARRCLGHSEDKDAPFFVSDTGARLSIQLAEQVFNRLRKIAEIHRQDGGRYQPRLHDLRHRADSPNMPTVPKGASPGCRLARSSVSG
jgi:site-specific recombinase XerD